MDSLWINGAYYQIADFLKSHEKIEALNAFDKGIISFIIDWISGKKVFELKTSGSTGQPKTICIRRDQMIASAEMTISYFNLKKGDKALLCLNPEYIAGKMMIVRSLVGQLDLYVLPPASNPLLNDEIDFEFNLIALVPYQISEILCNKQSIINFKKIKIVLIGGAELSEGVLKKLRKFRSRIFQTFGMTETVSHMALKRLSGDGISGLYEVLEGIEADTDERGCLTVQGKITGDKKIVTNDLVDFVDDSRFKWKGRIDQVVNTGGIIINIKDLENKIRNILKSNDMLNNIIVASLADIKLGEKIILLIETKSNEIDIKYLKGLLKNYLTKYEIPKEIYTIDNFQLTDTGKINRMAIIKGLVD